MESKGRNRRLAAILFTDIVGYTKLMQHDEFAAVSAVKKHQKVLEEQVPKHFGEIHQYYGDGSLCVFNSALDAVICAYEVQRRMLRDPVIPLRIGIHIGEIHFDDGKIFGDGVNVASRIESIGQPGTVFFSRHVFEKVRNHKELVTQSVGVFNFKNVDVPMEVFALVNPDITTPDVKRIDGKLKQPSGNSRRIAMLTGIIFVLLAIAAFIWLPGVLNNEEQPWSSAKSIAVLPFETIGAETDDEFLSVGIAEDILTQLSKVGDLKVVSRESSGRYRNSEKSLKTIARELGVATLLRGSLRRSHNKVRISVQLINPDTEAYIWAEDYDKEIADILNLQREVAEAVSDALQVNLDPVLRDQFQKQGAVDPDAYVSYLRGQEIMKTSSGDPALLARSVGYFEDAVRMDPEFALAWVGLAEAHYEYLYWGRGRIDDIAPKVRAAADTALSLDPDLGEAYCLLGSLAISEFDIDKGEQLLRKSLLLRPNYAPAYERLAVVVSAKGDFEEARRLVNKAVDLDPLSTRYVAGLAYESYMHEEYDVGIEIVKRYLEFYPGDNYLTWHLACLHYGKGQYDKAIELFKSRTITGAENNWMLGVTYASAGQTEKAQEILAFQLAKAQRTFVPYYIIAALYLSLDQPDMALDYLEQSVQSGNEANFLWGVIHAPDWERLRSHPRFQEIVEPLFGHLMDQ